MTQVVSRRQFLSVTGVAIPLLAQAPPAKARLIDVPHHVLPDFWKKAAALSLETMEKNGVETAICSLTAPAVWLNDVQGGRSLARQSNDYMAQLAQNHPGRFTAIGRESAAATVFAKLDAAEHGGSVRVRKSGIRRK